MAPDGGNHLPLQAKRGRSSDCHSPNLLRQLRPISHVASILAAIRHPGADAWNPCDRLDGALSQTRCRGCTVLSSAVRHALFNLWAPCVADALEAELRRLQLLPL